MTSREEMKFPANYAQARAEILRAAHATGAETVSYEAPFAGLFGDPLFVDVVRVGPTTGRALVTISGAHGNEGRCGSFCQTQWLRQLRSKRSVGFSVIHIHAINPFGFAAESRVNEDNIDINRNFQADWSSLPDNPGYESFSSLLEPDAWSPQQRNETRSKIDQLRHEIGASAVQAAVMGGQFRYPEGIFYGGQRPCWSHQIMERISREHLAGYTDLVVVDLHTGLGDYGDIEIIAFDAPTTPAFRRAQQWFAGDVTSIQAATASAKPISGPLLNALRAWLPRAELTLLAVEFGTRAVADVIDAIAIDNWARRHAPPGSSEWQAAKRVSIHTFGPEESAWQEAVSGCAASFWANLCGGYR